MMGEEQGKMQQSIGKKLETKSTQKSVTVMFYDRKAFLAVTDLFRGRENAAPSLSDAMTVGDPVVSPVPSLSRSLKVSDSRAHSRHRTRRRASPHIEKFSVGVPHARSALAVLAASPNSRSQNRCSNHNHHNDRAAPLQSGVKKEI